MADDDTTRRGDTVPEHPDVDDAGYVARQTAAKTQPPMRQDETPVDEEGVPIRMDIIEEVFIPLDEGVEPDRRELVTGDQTAENAEVRGFAGVVKAKKTRVKGVSGVTITEKAKVKGFAPVVVTSDEVKLKKAGVLFALAGKEVEVEEGSFLGIALTPKVKVEEGGKVLITPLVAILVGLAFGAGFGVVALFGLWVMRKGWETLRHRGREARTP